MQVLGTPDNTALSIDKTADNYTSTRRKNNNNVYTLGGVRVHNRQVAGEVYIQGGRKYVAR